MPWVKNVASSAHYKDVKVWLLDSAEAGCAVRALHRNASKRESSAQAVQLAQSLSLAKFSA